MGTINFFKKILKQKYILEELEKAGEDAKKLWKVLNFLIGKKDTPEKIEPEELDQRKVNQYNKYLANIGLEIQKELDIEFNSDVNNYHNLPPFKFENEIEIEIEK